MVLPRKDEVRLEVATPRVNPSKVARRPRVVGVAAGVLLHLPGRVPLWHRADAPVADDVRVRVKDTLPL